MTVASPRGAHAYYQDNTPRGNKHWQAFGCRGEVRSARGYLRLYEGGAERLASALRLTPSGTAPFPDDLFEAMGVEAPRMLPVEAPRVFRVKAPDDLPDLATMLPGGRNNALFDCVRFWSYAQDKAPNLDAWADRVERIASQGNERFPVPLAAGEVNRPAWSVASWTWAGGGPMDHTPATQCRRGLKSGRVRRAATRERDRAIVEAVEAGQSMRSVAKAYGLGALLVNNEAIHLVATFLEPEHFFLPVHGRIYAAVMHYVGRREIANPVTLRSCFENDEALQEAGGAQHLARLAGSAVTVINAGHYGRAIHDLHVRRALIDLAEDMRDTAYDASFDQLPTEQVERAESKLRELLEEGAPGTRSERRSIGTAARRGHCRHKRPARPMGRSWGFPRASRPSKTASAGSRHPT